MPDAKRIEEAAGELTTTQIIDVAKNIAILFAK